MVTNQSVNAIDAVSTPRDGHSATRVEHRVTYVLQPSTSGIGQAVWMVV